MIRQHLDYHHWYDRVKLTLKEVHNCQYVSCMNPTAGSFTINPRLQVRIETARSINSNRFTILVPGFYFYGINRIGSTRDHRNLFMFRLAALKQEKNTKVFIVEFLVINLEILIYLHDIKGARNQCALCVFLWLIISFTKTAI